MVSIYTDMYFLNGGKHVHGSINTRFDHNNLLKYVILKEQAMIKSISMDAHLQCCNGV